jgi:hypothetical protein
MADLINSKQTESEKDKFLQSDVVQKVFLSSLVDTEFGVRKSLLR